MRHVMVMAMLAFGLGVSSTSYAQSSYFEGFETYAIGTSGATISGPFSYVGPTMVDGSPLGFGQMLRWCNWHDIEVSQNPTSTIMQFNLLILGSTPVTVNVFDDSGSPGSVYPGPVFAPGFHQVMVDAGPNATIELRGGDCETWFDDVIGSYVP